MKRACFVVCSNGLGHFRRVVQVALALLLREKCLVVDLACAPQQVERMARWPVLHRLMASARVSFRFLDLYPRWPADEAYYKDKRLLTWQSKLASLNLDSYDLVVADNLVEVLEYQPCAVLMGSFFWHDLYAAHYGGEVVVQRYWARCFELLSMHRPRMIANRYFAMPAVGEQAQAIRVGMLPPIMGRVPKKKDHMLGVLFVGGSNVEVAGALASYLAAQATEKPGEQVQLFVDRRLAQQMSGVHGVEAFDFDRDDFARIDAVVGRPGMGIITDCVSSGTPLFAFHEENAEMEHNTRVLERLHLGRRLEGLQNALSQICAFFAAREGYPRYRRMLEHIDRKGLEQTVRFLSHRLVQEAPRKQVQGEAARASFS